MTKRYLFKIDPDDEEIFLCRLCDEEVDISDVNSHIKKCLASLNDLYGEEKLKKHLKDCIKTRELDDIEGGYEDLLDKIYYDNKFDDDSDDESKEENFEGESVYNEEKDKEKEEFLKRIKDDLYHIQVYDFEIECPEDMSKIEIKQAFLERLEGVINECENYEEKKEGNDD